MTAPVAFVDIETISLDRYRDCEQPIWEVGLIDPEGNEHRWFLSVDLGVADPVALDIGKYHERHPWGYDYVGDPDETVYIPCVESVSELPPGGAYTLYEGRPLDYGDFAAEFCQLTRPRNGQKVHLAGAVVSFDEERLWNLLKDNAACPEWAYHLVDVEALTAGWIGAQGFHPHRAFAGRNGELVDIKGGHPPWDSKALSRAVGVDPDLFRAHEALEDARWARAMYEAVLGRPVAG